MKNMLIGESLPLNPVEQPRETTDVYLIRHGQTVANTTEIMSGWMETPLTDVGITQAKAAGQALAQCPVGRIVSSDLSRARHTAQLVGEGTGIGQIALAPELREWHFGPYEGRPQQEMWRGLLPYLGISVDSEHYERASFWDNMVLLQDRGYGEAEMMDALAALDPSGEASTWQQYRERLTSAADLIGNNASEVGREGSALVVVSHGAFTRNLLPLLDPNGYDGRPIGNASITHLTHGDQGFHTVRVAVNPEDW